MKRILTLLAVITVALAGVLGAGPAAAQSSNVWQINYFPNLDWAGAPVYIAYASTPSFNWGSDTPPAPGMPAQNWTASMTSSTFFYGGTTRFQITADDEFALLIDGITYASTIGTGQSGKTIVADVVLSQGNHFVQVNYRQYTAAAYLYVSWQYLKSPTPVPPPSGPVPPPSGPQPPPATTFPPPATGPVTEFGDYTRCAQQQIHQVNCFQSNGAWDAPNTGSIETEPQIVRWMNCTPDSVTTIQLYPNQAAQSAACSKTGAGYFAR